MASKVEVGEAVTDRILKDLGRIQIASDEPLFSEGEKRALELYDQIQDVRLNRAILKAASQTPVSKNSGKQIEQELNKAERSMLEARAVYLLQRHIVDDILMLDPVLKAVYADPFQSSREKDLHDTINQRDVLSMTHGAFTTSVHDVQNRLIATQVESIKAVEENQKLAHGLRTLASQLRRKGPESVSDEDLKEALSSSLSELEKAKRRRRLIKGVVSAIVAGSGLDWSQDERLLRLVLEEEKI